MINLRFLGTGGLGAIRIKNKLSKDYRRFSTLLIDEKIIIDPSLDVFEFVESFMLNGILDEANDVFISHSHPDSFSLSAIEKLASMHKIRVYATEALKDELQDIQNAEFIPIAPFSLQKNDGYSILPLPSNHITDIQGEQTLNFLIEAQDKTVFYGIDGAFINPRAWQVLKQVKLDVAVLDFALGINDFSDMSPYHNNLKSAIATREIFINSGVASDDTKFILSHIPSGRKSPTHEAISDCLENTHLHAAYDGYFLGI